MATRLILMRHGTAKDAPDAPLSDIGLTEAHMASEKVAGWGITHVFSSPARRCVSTARILAKPVNVDVKADSRLEEDSGWERIKPFIDELKLIENGNVLAVTHTPVIKSVLVQLLGMAPEKIDASRMSPLSYSFIEFDGLWAKAGRLLADMFCESSKLRSD